jgi:ABC-type branched-subunit amino acid transport system substrate-binding protein
VGTVTLGNIAPTSGPAGAYGTEIINASRLAAQHAIEDGDVEDVEHINGDSQYDPSQARSVAIDHVSQDVDLLHGAVSDAATIAISELADQEDIPHIGRSGNLSFDLRECRPNTFSFSPSILGWTENGVGYCVRNGLGESVYTIGYDFSWPQDHVQYLTEEFFAINRC